MEVTRISPPRLAWLERESRRWRDAGMINPEVRERILSSYEVEPFVRGTVLLIVLALLMFGAGVLLIIGYNWRRIPDAAKVAMILASVAASFAGSAAAYARRRPLAGEMLAVAGTLFYANGIWLIAQVLHIQGYFPDAFLWFGIGAGLSAWLVCSTMLGIETAVLLVAWVVAASAASERPEYLFLAAWPAVLVLAYRLRSSVTLAIAAFAMPVWGFFSSVAVSREPLFLGVTAATGCAFYAVGTWHRDESRMKPAWQVAGLLSLLVTFIPLLASEVHRAGARHGSGFVVLPLAIVVGAAVCVATLARRPIKEPATAAIVVAAAAVFAWTMLLAVGMGGRSAFVLAATVAFSVLALLLSAAFIRTALRTNRSYEFGFGVLIAVVLLLVRWISVIRDMFLSGLIMLAAGVALLFVVRLWRQRDRALALHGRLS